MSIFVLRSFKADQKQQQRKVIEVDTRKQEYYDRYFLSAPNETSLLNGDCPPSAVKTFRA